MIRSAPVCATFPMTWMQAPPPRNKIKQDLAHSGPGSHHASINLRLPAYWSIDDDAGDGCLHGTGCMSSADVALT